MVASFGTQSVAQRPPAKESEIPEEPPTSGVGLELVERLVSNLDHLRELGIFIGMMRKKGMREVVAKDFLRDTDLASSAVVRETLNCNNLELAVEPFKLSSLGQVLCTRLNSSIK